MISQDTKDQIDKDIEKIPFNLANLEYIAINGKINGTLLIGIRELLTKYAEKLEEKDKEIEKLTEDSCLWKIAHDNCANHFDDLKKQLESKDREIEQMKSKVEMYISINEDLVTTCKKQDCELAELKSWHDYYKERAEKGEGILKSATDIHFIPGKEGDNLLAAKDREIEELKAENAHLHAEKFIIRPEELEKENAEWRRQHLK